MDLQIKSLEDTKKLAVELSAGVKAGNVYALYGDLGSGKTTFTGYFTKEIMGEAVRVQSPTFVIARTYINGNVSAKIRKIFHLDLYRIQSLTDLHELDIDDFFNDPAAVTIIEWPEIAEEILPKDKTVRIYFKYIDETTRQIKIQNLH